MLYIRRFAFESLSLLSIFQALQFRNSESGKYCGKDPRGEGEVARWGGQGAHTTEPVLHIPSRTGLGASKSFSSEIERWDSLWPQAWLLLLSGDQGRGTDIGHPLPHQKTQDQCDINIHTDPQWLILSVLEVSVCISFCPIP